VKKLVKQKWDECLCPVILFSGESQICRKMWKTKWKWKSVQLQCFLFQWICQQMLLHVLRCYILSWDIKKEFLFCKELRTTTSADVSEKIKSFFVSAELQWKYISVVCSLLTELLQWWNHVQVFRKKFKNLFLKQKVNTCVVHTCALPSRTLPTPLKNGLDSTIQIIDYIKSGSLNSCLFKELYKDMKSAHGVLLFHTSVRSLRKETF